MTNNKINQWYNKYCYTHHIDTDVFDISMEIDSGLTDEENINILEEKLTLLADKGILQKKQAQKTKIANEKHAEESCMIESEFFSRFNLDATDSIGIVGNRNTGKTSLAYRLIQQYSGNRKIYLYGYPEKWAGCENIYSLRDMLKLENAIIFCDELQRFFPLWNRKILYGLIEMLSFLAHRKNTFIFSTQLTQNIHISLEASIQTWFLKQIDLRTLKAGSKIKQIFQEIASKNIMQNDMILENNQMIWYDDLAPIGSKGVYWYSNPEIQKVWASKIEIKEKVKI